MITRAASAPALFACLVSIMVSLVELEPVPAITGIPPSTVFMVISTTFICSSWLRVADSPVVPHGTMQWVPESMCHWISALKPSSSNSPSLKGVIMATIAPPIRLFCLLPVPSSILPIWVPCVIIIDLLRNNFSLVLSTEEPFCYSMPYYRIFRPFAMKIGFPPVQIT